MIKVRLFRPLFLHHHHRRRRRPLLPQTHRLRRANTQKKKNQIAHRIKNSQLTKMDHQNRRIQVKYQMNE